MAYYVVIRYFHFFTLVYKSGGGVLQREVACDLSEVLFEVWI